jgi:hypothetical protein
VSALPQVQVAFGLQDALNPDTVIRDVYPKPDANSEWPYDNCSDGASIWLPAPVEAAFWVFTEFRDELVQAGLGLEFKRRARRTMWLESLAEGPHFNDEFWSGHVLVQRTDFTDIARVQDTLEVMLGNFLTDLNRARRAPAEA